MIQYGKSSNSAMTILMTAHLGLGELQMSRVKSYSDGKVQVTMIKDPYYGIGVTLFLDGTRDAQILMSQQTKRRDLDRLDNEIK